MSKLLEDCTLNTNFIVCIDVPLKNKCKFQETNAFIELAFIKRQFMRGPIIYRIRVFMYYVHFTCLIFLDEISLVVFYQLCGLFLHPSCVH